MATINGTPVNFGFGTAAGITISGISGILLQSAEQSKEADMEAARNGVGDEVTHGWYNIHDQAQLEWIISGTGLANAITNTALQTPGTLIGITACPQMTSLVGTTWEVQQGCKISGSNTTNKRLTLPIKSYAGIQAQAGA